MTMRRWLSTMFAGGLGGFAAITIYRAVEFLDTPQVMPRGEWPAWLQAFGGMAALGVTMYFANHARKAADNSEARARRVEDRAENEKHAVREDVIAAARFVADRVIDDLDDGLELVLATSDPAKLSNTIMTCRFALRRHAEVVQVLIGRAVDGALLHALADLRSTISALEIGGGSIIDSVEGVLLTVPVESDELRDLVAQILSETQQAIRGFREALSRLASPTSPSSDFAP